MSVIEKINNNWLFPNIIKIPAWILIVLGIVFGIIRFVFSIKLPIFKIGWPAIYSKFLETKYFFIMPADFSDEVPALFLLIGLFLLVFSKEKIEDEEIHAIRISSLFKALYINFLFLLVSILFTFGFGFIQLLFAQIFSFWIIYLVLFNFEKQQLRKTISREIENNSKNN